MNRRIDTPSIKSRRTPAEGDRLDLSHVQRLADAGLSAEEAWPHLSPRERQYVTQVGQVDLARATESAIDLAEEYIGEYDARTHAADLDLSNPAESETFRPDQKRDSDADLLRLWESQ